MNIQPIYPRNAMANTTPAAAAAPDVRRTPAPLVWPVAPVALAAPLELLPVRVAAVATACASCMRWDTDVAG